ncbi:MAG: hypothetical protein WC565_08155 [Parcubacteria group bacterium]|jgi:hypothetical protein
MKCVLRDRFGYTKTIDIHHLEPTYCRPVGQPLEYNGCLFGMSDLAVPKPVARHIFDFQYCRDGVAWYQEKRASC